MTEKQLEGTPGTNPTPPMAMPTDWKQVKFAAPTDEDMNLLAALRSGSEPWKLRGETQAESLEALTKLRPFISVGKLSGAVTGYVDQNADVTSVCIGTGKRNDLQYYYERRRVTGDYHGQAPVLWAASALLR